MRFSDTGRNRAVWFTLFAICALLVCAGMAGAVSGGNEEAAPKGWVATDTYRVMNFGVLFIGLFLLLRKPVAQALGARIKGIKEQLAELEQKKDAAQKQLEVYQEKLAKLDEEAEKIVEEYIRQGKEAKAKIIEAAQLTAVKLEDQAKRNIEHEFKQAKTRLQEEVLEKAMLKAEEVIKAKITSDDQDRLVDEYLEKVVA